ncbi:MAG: S9 family peptidase [Acidobacteria bacterium]|nr:S9 family peptidase [Acidobacteriota bacterium]
MLDRRRRPPRFLVLALAAVLLPSMTRAAEGPGEDLATTVARMGQVGSCGSPSFSADGSRLAVVCDLSGLPQVWTVDAHGGWPIAVTASDDQVGRVEWSPDGAWLAFDAASGGALDTQVWLVRPDGTELRRITPDQGESNRLTGWSHDERFVLLSSNRRSPADNQPYLYEPASGKTELVTPAAGWSFTEDLSPSGDRAIVWRMKNRGDNDLFLVRRGGSADPEEVLLTPHDGPGTFGGGRFTRDGKTLYLAANQGRDLLAFARIRLGEDGTPSPIEVLAARDDAELESFAMTEDDTLAALLWNVAGRSELEFYDLATGARRPAPALPAEIVGSLTFSHDGRRLAFTATGAAAPRDVWTLDLGTGALHQVTVSPHPGVDLASLVRPELLRYPAHDGLELSGWLYRPPGVEGPAPYVLSFHGGPEGQERPVFRAVYQALLAQGIGVFAPNVRGSSGFGKRFVNLDNGALRADGVRDIEASAKALTDAAIADPARLGIMGGSYGGYMVVAGLTSYPRLFAAGADLYGVVNFETFFAHTEPYIAAISKIEYGDPDTEAEMLRELSPIHKVDRIVAPTLVLHGANDTNVPVVEAEQVVHSLESRDVPVHYVLFPDEGHGFRKVENRVTSTVEIVRWFVKYLEAGG